MRPLSELFGKEREQRQSVKPTLEVWSRGRIPAKVSERAATVAAVVRTHLTRRVVAHGKDEIERGRPRRCKLIPALAAQSLRRQVHFLEQLKRDRVNYSVGVTAGAEATEATATPLTNDALRQDAPRGVAGAQEQYVIWPISHGFCPDGLYQRRVFAMQVADSGHSDRNSSLASTAGGTLSRSMVR